MEFLKNRKDFFKDLRLDIALNEMLCDAREFADKIDIPANFELTQPRHRAKNSETLASSSSGIQKILELIFFATAIEKNVQQTVAAAMTIVTTCNFTFRSHPPLSRKPRLSIYTGDVLVTSSTVMLRTLKNGTAALGNHSLSVERV
ncbi:hypothetical protein TNCV_36131 [Trichonephila clavipes]|nr:hypothetical protein TNCV_36131 [Trichonephila clavipes]